MPPKPDLRLTTPDLRLATIKVTVRLQEAPPWPALRRFGLLVAPVLLVPQLGAQAGKVVIVQTNSAGDSVSPHRSGDRQDRRRDSRCGSDPRRRGGARRQPPLSQQRIDGTLDIVDTKTLKITKKIPLTGRPNNVAIRKDGRRSTSPSRRRRGRRRRHRYRSTQERTKFIRILGGVHNTFITPDSKYVVAGSTGGIGRDGDRHRDGTAGLVDPLRGRRPADLFRDQPGRFDQADVRADHQPARLRHRRLGDSGRRSGRIKLPDVPPAERNSEGIQGAPAHGILIAPDGKTLWSTSKINSAVYAYSMPDLKYLGAVQVGKVPDWLTFTPDSKKLYVANAHDNIVSVIDVAARKEITQDQSRARCRSGTSRQSCRRCRRRNS